MSALPLDEMWVDQGRMQHCRSAQLNVELELIEVTTLAGHSKPDPRWTHVDRAGHWHAAATRPAVRAEIWYPTLEEHRRRNPEFDPDARDWEEYDVPEWLAWLRCSICAERVDPKMITSFDRQYLPGRPTWRINIEVADPTWFEQPRRGARFTVRGVQVLPGSRVHPSGGRREWFGVASWVPASLRDVGGEASMVTGTFEGVGDLGERVG